METAVGGDGESEGLVGGGGAEGAEGAVVELEGLVLLVAEGGAEAEAFGEGSGREGVGGVRVDLAAEGEPLARELFDVAAVETAWGLTYL